MKKYLTVLLVSLNVVLFSQKTIEGGLLLGGTYYLGDVNHTEQFNSTQFCFGAFIRRNLNKRIAYRLNLSYGSLDAKDANFDRNYQVVRDYSFNTSLMELVAQAEFNFLPYKLGANKHTSFYTPYLASGIGVAIVEISEKSTNLILPLSIGVKFSVLPKIEIGLEWAFRKTFTDDLDNLIGQQYDVINMDVSNREIYRQKSTYYTNDWYSFVGLFITYKLFQSGGACKAYDY